MSGVGLGRARGLYHGDMAPAVSSRLVRRALSTTLLVVCGCQRYVELGNSPALTRGDVRLTVSDETASVQYGAIGSNVQQVEGSIISATDSAVTLSVTSVTRRTGLAENWAGESVAIPRRAITVVEARQLSFPRTLATLGAMVAGGFVARGAMSGGDGNSSGVKKPGGGN